MPIISAETIEEKLYRVTTTLGHGMIENVVITSDGLYSVYYIKNGRSINATGRILKVVQSCDCSQNNYILFDLSDDNSNRKERIYFYQVQFIKDITPNNAYTIALEHGFKGTVEDWLQSLKGDPGKDNYEIAVECGFTGNRDEWLQSIRGERGYSAYDIAVQHGFKGTEDEWLRSLKGRDGKSAYEIAVEHGFEGTEEDFAAQNGDVYALKKRVNRIENNLEWKDSVTS